MQEEHSKQQIRMAVKISGKGLKITGKLLVYLFKKFVVEKVDFEAMKQGKKQHIGRLSMGGNLESVEVNNSNIARFKHSARRFGVDFAIKKDRNTGEQYLFFKAKDKDAIDHALHDFYGRDKKYRNSAVFKGKEKAKESVLKKIKDLKQKTKENIVSTPEKKKNIGDISL